MNPHPKDIHLRFPSHPLFLPVTPVKSTTPEKTREIGVYQTIYVELLARHVLQKINQPRCCLRRNCCFLSTFRVF